LRKYPEPSVVQTIPSPIDVHHPNHRNIIVVDISGFETVPNLVNGASTGKRVANGVVGVMYVRWIQFLVLVYAVGKRVWTDPFAVTIIEVNIVVLVEGRQE
jgi:hypothetical protein